MSFNFTWPEFSSSFISDAAAMLDSALNKGVKPKVIADDIKVEDINMGSIPPELEILEIGELSTDRFRGIFRLTYAGDAHLTLSTKVQANPLSRPAPTSSVSAFEDASSVFPSSMPSRGILFAARPLIVPMKLRLSSVRLKAIVVLVVSKQKGITLVFKNDPLESVDVSSTFDSVAVIQKYLQQEIEGQLREMFREDLPGIIHRLSQRWLSGNREGQKNTSGGVSKTNAPTKPTVPGGVPPNQQQASSSSPSKTHTGLASLGSSPEKKHMLQKPQRAVSEAHSMASANRSPSRRRKAEKFAAGSTPPSPRTTHRGSTMISTSPRNNNNTKAKSTTNVPTSRLNEEKSDPNLSSSFGLSRGWNSGLMDDMERYDPTYGLRPDEVRMTIHGGGYSGLARLAGQVNGGLRDLAIPEKSIADDQDAREERSTAIVPHSDEDLTDEERDVGLDSMDEVDRMLHQEQDTLYNLDLSDEDDVPDRPHSDDDDVQDLDQDGSAGDFTMYGYPPPGAAFSDTAVEDSARQSTSVFGVHSPPGGSPKPSQAMTRSQSLFSGSKSGSISSSGNRGKRSNQVEYETIPAVGGGIITRPRIYHTASRVQAPEVEDDDEVGDYYVGGSATASSTARGPSSSQAFTIRPSRSYRDDIEESVDDFDGDEREGETGTDDSPSAQGHESIATLDPEPMDPNSTAYRTQLYRHQYGRLYRAGYGRQSSMSSTLSSSEASRSGNGRVSSEEYLARSNSRSSTAPTSTYPSTNADNTLTSPNGRMPSSPSERRELKSQGTLYSNNTSPIQPPHNKYTNIGPSQSMTVGASHHFMDLVNSNHTLSPFTRTLDTKGFAVRSHPVTPSTGSGGETSSSAGGISSRPLPHSSTFTPSHQRKESNGYFERSKAPSETGRGKRRTFKIGGKSASENGGQAAVLERRPDSTPIQQPRLSSFGPKKAHSSYAIEEHGRAKNSNNSIPTQGPRRLSRQFTQSERAAMTMGAIRE